MEIQKNIKIIDLALLIGDTLIIADTHIGQEEAMTKQGVLVPQFQFKETVKRLEHILKKTKPKTVIINGDIKEEFGTISDQEWRNTLKLIDFILKYADELILVKGNHDTILGPIAKKRNTKVVDYLIIDENSRIVEDKKAIEKITNKKTKIKIRASKNNILIIHGDQIPDKRILKKIKTIIIGHEHPAIGVTERIRTETFKCFLRGKWKKYNLIVLPSFNQIIEGHDVLKEEHVSPFMDQPLGNFEVYIVGDKVYEFGKIKHIH